MVLKYELLLSDLDNVRLTKKQNTYVDIPPVFRCYKIKTFLTFIRTKIGYQNSSYIILLCLIPNRCSELVLHIFPTNFGNCLQRSIFCRYRMLLRKEKKPQQKITTVAMHAGRHFKQKIIFCFECFCLFISHHRQCSSVVG